MSKKYEFTGETMVLFGKTLHQIRALVDFGNVHTGDLGGWIEKEDNLSHEGFCWVSGNALVFEDALVYEDAEVYGDAWVFENAKVYGDAQVSGNAQVYGNAQVSGKALAFGETNVYGNARIYGDAQVSGNAKVFGNAWVYGDVWVSDNAKVSDDAWVCGDAQVYGNAKVYGDAEVCSPNHIMWISNIGSRNDTVTFTRSKDSKILVNTGCFSGTLEEFEKKVNETHGDNEHAKAYHLAVELAKIKIHLD